MEAAILKSLNFELGSPTVKTFLQRFNRVAQDECKNPNLQVEFLAHYLAELSLLDYNCVKFLPYLVAASVFLARFMIMPKKQPWGGGLQAVREKYKLHKFKCVANIPSSPEIPNHLFEDAR